MISFLFVCEDIFINLLMILSFIIIWYFSNLKIFKIKFTFVIYLH